MLAYRRGFRARVARDGLLATAPVSLAFPLVTLVVSGLWRVRGWHRAVAACCAWRAADLPHAPAALLPLLGSAFLTRRPLEAAWTVAAAWLVLAPLEAALGSAALLALGAAGHVVPTVLADLCWLAGIRTGWGSSLAGLDVGTSAVIVTAAAALAVVTRSAPVGAALAAGLAVDLAVDPGLATAEHLLAAAIGAAAAFALRHALPRRSRQVPSGRGAAIPPRASQVRGN